MAEANKTKVFKFCSAGLHLGTKAFRFMKGAGLSLSLCYRLRFIKKVRHPADLSYIGQSDALLVWL